MSAQRGKHGHRARRGNERSIRKGGTHVPWEGREMSLLPFQLFLCRTVAYGAFAVPSATGL